jgi:hypothetical protein
VGERASEDVRFSGKRSSTGWLPRTGPSLSRARGPAGATNASSGPRSATPATIATPRRELACRSWSRTRVRKENIARRAASTSSSARRQSIRIARTIVECHPEVTVARGGGAPTMKHSSGRLAKARRPRTLYGAARSLSGNAPCRRSRVRRMFAFPAGAPSRRRRCRCPRDSGAECGRSSSSDISRRAVGSGGHPPRERLPSKLLPGLS